MALSTRVLLVSGCVDTCLLELQSPILLTYYCFDRSIIIDYRRRFIDYENSRNLQLYYL